MLNKLFLINDLYLKKNNSDDYFDNEKKEDD